MFVGNSTKSFSYFIPPPPSNSKSYFTSFSLYHVVMMFVLLHIITFYVIHVDQQL